MKKRDDKVKIGMEVTCLRCGKSCLQHEELGSFCSLKCIEQELWGLALEREPVRKQDWK